MDYSLVLFVSFVIAILILVFYIIIKFDYQDRLSATYDQFMKKLLKYKDKLVKYNFYANVEEEFNRRNIPHFEKEDLEGFLTSLLKNDEISREDTFMLNLLFNDFKECLKFENTIRNISTGKSQPIKRIKPYITIPKPVNVVLISLLIISISATFIAAHLGMYQQL